MWRKRQQEKRKRAASPLASAQLAGEVIATSVSTTSREPEPGSALIGNSVVVKGQIYSREDLHVDGEVDGRIELQEHRLTVGPHGKVQASIKAREVVVVGTVHGNVEAAEKFDIRKEAKLVGDIKTARIAVEDGAYLKGSVDIPKPEDSRSAPPPQSRGDTREAAPGP